MSPAAALLLPRTRTFQRRRPLRVWWIAAVIAIVVNVGVVIGLSQISHLHVPLPEAPVSVRTIRQVEPELPPPPPPQRETPPEPLEEPLAIALPMLDLPNVSTPEALTVPDVPNLAVNFDLPLSVPAFTTIATTTSDVAVGVLTIAEPDQPAALQGTFDLERFYPRAARLRGIQGRSRLRLSIDERGVVTDVTVFEATPAGVFDHASEQLGRSLPFTPARRDGKPVPTTKDLIIDWTLK